MSSALLAPAALSLVSVTFKAPAERAKAAAGLGLVFAPLSSVALPPVRPSDAGVANALLNATEQVSGAFGVALINTLYAPLR